MSAASRHTSHRQFLIVLPVHNGGEYLKACVASILAQVHEHFRLVVLENSSTDDTQNWLRQLRDPGINVRESPAPLEIESNWARILQLDLSEEFLTIIGHDDLLDPGYLSQMSALIDAHPDAGLYQSHFRLIDKRGRRLRSCLPMPARETAEGFLAARLRLRRDSQGTGYMFRTSDYLRVGGIPLYKKLMFADDALWLGLMRGSYKSYPCARDVFVSAAFGRDQPLARLEIHVRLACLLLGLLEELRPIGPRGAERHATGHGGLYDLLVSMRVFFRGR